jgi:hypothetical protein
MRYHATYCSQLLLHLGYQGRALRCQTRLQMASSLV